jgi:hypothetical protein
MELELASATVADAARLTEITRAAKAHWGYPAAWLQAWEGALQVSPDYFERHVVFAAAVAGTVAGFYGLEDRGER